MKTQKVNTPKIIPCECGADTRVVSDDGDFRQGGGYGFMYRVECQKNHVKTKYCGSYHRAICRWNNSFQSNPQLCNEGRADNTRQIKIMKELKIAVETLRRIAKLDECCEIERGENGTRHDVAANQIAEDALKEMGFSVSENSN